MEHQLVSPRARWIPGLFLWASAIALASSGLAAAANEQPTPMLVGDFSPGTRPAYFDPNWLTPAGGLLYLEGSDDQHGGEPWVSDGTAAGTRRLADLCPGTCSSYPGQFTELGERVIFYSLGNDALYAIQNFAVEELERGLEEVSGLVRHGSLVYFTAKQNGRYQNWRSDGTSAGTRPTEVFCTGETCGTVGVFVLGDSLYFTQPNRLYTLVGGDQKVLVAILGGSAYNFKALDNSHFFFSVCSDDQQCQLWFSDGTSAGTHPVEPAPGNLTRNASHLVPWRGRMYFTSGDGQLASTDGTAAGTRPESTLAGSHPVAYASNNSALLYTLEVSTTALEKQILVAHTGIGTDVQLAGPYFDLGPQGTAPKLGEKIFFETFDHLLVTDGSPQGTIDLGQFTTSSTGAVFGSLYYFGLSRNGLSTLWRSDGTLAGTTIAELGLTSANSSYLYPHRLGSQLLLELHYGYASTEPTLFRIDPETFSSSPADARKLGILATGKTIAFGHSFADEAPYLFAIDDHALVELPADYLYETALAGDGHLFFTDRRPGQELLESDGTVAGTRLLFDLSPGYVPTCGSHHCTPTYPIEITPSGENVFFVAPSADHQAESLWAYRRGQAGPVEIHRKDFYFGQPLAIGGKVVFSGSKNGDGASPISLFVSDGSLAGTRPFFDLPSSQTPFPVVPARDRLFFGLGYPTSLWVTDLTSTGTVQLLATPGSKLTELVAAGRNLFFTGEPGPDEGRELGFSDGTLAGTRWLDLVPGVASSYPQNLYPLADGRVVFAAAADAAGFELWISDGTLAGTRRLTDLAPGGDASSPQDFLQIGQRLFFSAHDGRIGRELWAIDLPPGRAECPAGKLCLQNGRFEVEVTAHTDDGDFVGKKASGNADSAIFSFFSANNWEMLVKVLDGCAINQNFWVFAASATDVGFTLTVTDRDTGAQKIYRNSLGNPAIAITDTAAFSCPGLETV